MSFRRFKVNNLLNSNQCWCCLPYKEGVSNKTPTEKVYKSVRFATTDLIIRTKNKKVGKEWKPTKQLTAVLQRNVNGFTSKDYLRGSELLKLLEFLHSNIDDIKTILKQDRTYETNTIKQLEENSS